MIFEKSPNWPWPQMNNMGLERLIRLVPGKKYHVQIIVDDTIATLYVDGVALNTRMYTNPGEESAWELQMEVRYLRIKVLHICKTYFEIRERDPPDFF
ncbi:MAG: hypothetical protein ACLTVV_08450 [Ruminococcus sp.]